MKAIYIDSMTLMDRADPASKRTVLIPVSGLGAPSIRISSFDKAGEDGHKVVASFTGERRLGIKGVIEDVDCDELVVLRREMSALLMPTRDSNGELVLKTLRFRDDDDSEFRLEGTVVSFDMPLDGSNSAEYFMDFLGDGASIDSYNSSSQTLEVASLGGAVVPFVLPVILSGGSGGSENIINNGNLSAYPIITLDGSLTNPRIANNTTGEWVQLNISMSLGEQIIIDMENRTVIQGGVTNQIATMSDDSVFWRLAPGSNTVTLSTGVIGEEGTATVTWYDAYAGL